MKRTPHKHRLRELPATLVVTSDPRLSDARTPLAHTHGGSDITSQVADAAHADDADVAVYAATAGSADPTAHAASHQPGGSDEVAVDTPAVDSIPKTGGNPWLALGWLLRDYGTVSLALGQATVSTANVSASSLIMLTVQDQGGGNVGAIFIRTRNPGTDFIIFSTNLLDDSLVAWLILEP